MMKLFGFKFQRASFILLSLALLKNVALADNIITQVTTQNGLTFNSTFKNHLTEKYNQQEYYEMMNAFGTTSLPYAEIDHKVMIGDRVAYDVHYTTGELGLRIVPASLLNANATNHLIIGGDSNTFGQGCLDAESIAPQLSRFLKNYKVYNFGQRGGGPHNTLALMENYPIENLIKEKRGFFLYNFFPGYMFERVIGSKSYTSWDFGKSPYYDLDNEGKLVQFGQFRDRKIISFVYKFINSHSWLNKLIPDLPRINKHHIEITANIFLEMKKEYLSKFPNGNFIVIINESYQFKKSKTALILIDMLKEKNIDVIVVPYKPDIKKRYLLEDMHFNGKGQEMQSKIIAEQILKRLK